MFLRNACLCVFGEVASASEKQSWILLLGCCGELIKENKKYVKILCKRFLYQITVSSTVLLLLVFN